MRLHVFLLRRVLAVLQNTKILRNSIPNILFQKRNIYITYYNCTCGFIELFPTEKAWVFTGL